MNTLLHLPELVGRYCLFVLRYFVDLTAFCQGAIHCWLAGARGLNRANRHALIAQTIFTGIGALPFVVFIAGAIALVFTAQIVHFSSEVSNDVDVINYLTHAICFEIGPLMTAIILISRSGSAITVDIGNMKLRGEIDGLTLLAVDIDDYIVAPRLFGCALSQTILAIYFSAVALYGGILIAGVIYSPRYFFAMGDALLVLSPATIGLFVIKNVLFGIIIAGTACFQALQVEGCVTQLPQHTQKAIIRALVQIFLIDMLFALLVL